MLTSQSAVPRRDDPSSAQGRGWQSTYTGGENDRAKAEEAMRETGCATAALCLRLRACRMCDFLRTPSFLPLTLLALPPQYRLVGVAAQRRAPHAQQSADGCGGGPTQRAPPLLQRGRRRCGAPSSLRPRSAFLSLFSPRQRSAPPHLPEVQLLSPFSPHTRFSRPDRPLPAARPPACPPAINMLCSLPWVERQAQLRPRQRALRRRGPNR